MRTLSGPLTNAIFAATVLVIALGSTVNSTPFPFMSTAAVSRFWNEKPRWSSAPLGRGNRLPSRAGEQPDVSVEHRVKSIQHTRPLAAKDVLIPGERLGRIRAREVDVMEAQIPCMLDQFDPGPPGVDEKCNLEQVGDVAHGAFELEASRCQRCGFRAQVGEREPNVDLAISHNSRPMRDESSWCLRFLVCRSCRNPHVTEL